MEKVEKVDKVEDDFEAILQDTIEDYEKAVEAAEVKRGLVTRIKMKLTDVYVTSKISMVLAVLRKYLLLVFVETDESEAEEVHQTSVSKWLIESPIGPIRSLRRLFDNKVNDVKTIYIRFFSYSAVMFFSLFCDWLQSVVFLMALTGCLFLSSRIKVKRLVLFGKEVPLLTQVGALALVAVPFFYRVRLFVPLLWSIVAATFVTGALYVNELIVGSYLAH